MIALFDTFQSSFLLPFSLGGGVELPPALAEMTDGQPVWVKRQAERYYGVLLKHHQIDPKTVTPEEFLEKSAEIAENDPTFDDWANRIMDVILTFDSQLKASREAREQERQAFMLDHFIRSRELDEKLARQKAVSVA